MDRKRCELLVFGHLEGLLSPGEQVEFAGLLESSSDVRRMLVGEARHTLDLSLVLGRGVPSARKRRPAPRARESTKKQGWVPALVAAGILVVALAAWFLSSSPGETGSP